MYYSVVCFLRIGFYKLRIVVIIIWEIFIKIEEFYLELRKEKKDIFEVLVGVER